MEKILTCNDCIHQVSMESDCRCYIYCSITERDFTFPNSNETICENFEKDELILKDGRKI